MKGMFLYFASLILGGSFIAGILYAWYRFWRERENDKVYLQRFDTGEIEEL